VSTIIICHHFDGFQKWENMGAGFWFLNTPVYIHTMKKKGAAYVVIEKQAIRGE